MTLPGCSLRPEPRRRIPAPGRAAGALGLLLAFLLAGCQSLSGSIFSTADVPPLEYGGNTYLAEDVLSNSHFDAPDVLAIDDEMRAFIELHTRGNHNQRARLVSLHDAVKGAGGLDLQYDPFADGGAIETYHRGTANCLSYANMFVAMAREAGLNARYQWMEIRPEWHRIGERVAVRLHVNVQVKTRDGVEYMVDIDPLSRREIAGSRLISDEDALALHYNNLAMIAFAEENAVEAWSQLVKGLEVSPGLSQLWVNLGAIYRYSGQYREAEQAYFHALDIDIGDRSAMNNLVVLYELEGREDERAYWHDRMKRYREANPYFHANLGDLAMQGKQYAVAYEHYARATKIQPKDGQLIYNQGVAAYKMGDNEKAHELISLAIERAVFSADRERYRIELRSLEEQQAASL